MPQPHLRTRTKKRLKVALPGSRSQTHYKKEVTSQLRCYMCGQALAGIPHLATPKMRKLDRSERRIWRIYGGKLCHNCLKNALKHAARTV
jgi:large subunit ribosomal protein L34e